MSAYTFVQLLDVFYCLEGKGYPLHPYSARVYLLDSGGGGRVQSLGASVPYRIGGQTNLPTKWIIQKGGHNLMLS